MNRKIDRITLYDDKTDKRADLNLKELNPETCEGIFQTIMRDIGSCGYTKKIVIELENGD